MKAPSWKELVGGRCIIKKLEIGSNPVEVIITEVSPSGEFVKIHLIDANLVAWAKCEDFELCEILPHITPLGLQIAAMRLLEELRQGDSVVVEIHQPNEDGDGPNNELITVNAEWTGWDDVDYRGATLHEALQRALTHKKTHDSQTK